MKTERKNYLIAKATAEAVFGAIDDAQNAEQWDNYDAAVESLRGAEISFIFSVRETALRIAKPEDREVLQAFFQKALNTESVARRLLPLALRLSEGIL